MSENFDPQISNVESTSTATALPRKKGILQWFKRQRKAVKFIVILWAIVILVITILMFSSSNSLLDSVEPANNQYGMQFDLTLDEFIQNYNSSFIGDDIAFDIWGITTPLKIENVEESCSRYTYSFLDDRAAFHVFVDTSTKKIRQINYVFSIKYLNRISDTGKNTFEIVIPTRLYSALSGLDNIERCVEIITKTKDKSPSVIWNHGISSRIAVIAAPGTSDEAFLLTILAQSKSSYIKES